MKLIFVISQPRSGSTLLQAILSNNEAIATTSEPWLLLPLLSVHRPDIVNASFGWHISSSAIREFEDKYGNESDGYFSIIKESIYKIYSLVADEKSQYVLDKTPRYYEILAEIYSLFPESKFIILKRNPFAVLSSIIKTFPMYKRLEISLQNYARDILEAPFLIQKFLDENLGRENIMEVKYEDLVKNAPEIMAKLASWLELDVRAVDLDYSNNKKFKGSLGDPLGIHKHSTVNSLSIDAWEQHANEDANLQGLFVGYSNYLSSEFLEKYGNYPSFNNSKRTKLFDLFKHVYENDLSKKNSLFSFVEYIKFKLYTLTSVKMF